MRRFIVSVLLLLILGLSVPAFVKSSDASISGTITDPSGAVLPGVTVTATNISTGVVTTAVSNNAGVYSFSSLLPGVYKVVAAMRGFQTMTYTDVQLGNAAQLRLNFPENFIKTNPQFDTANYITNSDRSNYHSMQAQVTLRPTHGVSFTSTYTWSKNLGVVGAATDPLNRNADYTLLAGNRTHVFVTYGTFDLPFGPGQKIGGNTHGISARLNF